MKMKKAGISILLIMLVFLLTAAVPAMAADNYVENGGQIPDTNLYPGGWEKAYAQILNSHAQAIAEYESRPIEYYLGSAFRSVSCRPIGIEDLNADGVPELIFMEAASGGSRGDLYIYSWSSQTASCKLYVPGITRLDYDDLLGFQIYLSAYGGDTLVIEHYEYEWPWLLQFTRNAFGQYTLTNYLHAEYDNSGEGGDSYLWNGSRVDEAGYTHLLESIRNGRTRTVSDYISPDSRTYGFTYTRSSAAAELQGSSGYSSGSSSGNSSGKTSGKVSGSFDGIYGYTTDKLSTRKGPSTTYEGGGTYSVKNQWIKVLAKAWDKRNSIWWVKCEIPYHGQTRVLWTGYKRFDPDTLPLDQLPEEIW